MNRVLRPASLLLTAISLAGVAAADINGFGNFSNFSVNQADGGSAPAVFPGRIRLTSQSTAQSRSVFCFERQNVTEFTASFTYQLQNAGNGNNLWGGCFVIQNDSDGAGAVGAFNAFGYTTITPSVAASLEISNPYRTGLYTCGSVGGGAADMSPVNLRLGNPIDVTFIYDGSMLSTTVRDTVTGDQFDIARIINIPAEVGGSLAYVGFTASTSLGSNFTGDQYFSNFRFVPEPATFALVGLTAALLRRR